MRSLVGSFLQRHEHSLLMSAHTQTPAYGHTHPHMHMHLLCSCTYKRWHKCFAFIIRRNNKMGGSRARWRPLGWSKYICWKVGMCMLMIWRVCRTVCMGVIVWVCTARWHLYDDGPRRILMDVYNSCTHVLACLSVCMTVCPMSDWLSVFLTI
jgi:hypothetical protein